MYYILAVKKIFYVEVIITDIFNPVAREEMISSRVFHMYYIDVTGFMRGTKVSQSEIFTRIKLRFT